MTLAVRVMGLSPLNHLVKDGIQGRKPAPTCHTHSSSSSNLRSSSCRTGTSRGDLQAVDLWDAVLLLDIFPHCPCRC